jgi:flavin-dependent dehydrogenase
VVAISRDSKLRLREALTEFPSLERRLNPVLETTVERGGASITCRLRAVHRGNVALIGDASGSVDAITGEGLCLVFQQAQALADALAADDLSLYEKAHRAFRRRPTFMADLMLSLERRHRVRAAVVGTFSRHPQWFARLLALHVGAVRPATARENPLRAAAASSGSRA